MLGQLRDDRPALGEHRRAGRPVDRTIDAAAAEQAGVRRVHDDIDVGLGDVTEHRPKIHRLTVGSPA